MSTPRNDYESITKRTFRQALIHLLETEYKILGSHRVLEMMATDVQALVDEYHPPAERSRAGDLIWTTTASSESKPGKGKKTEECQHVTIALPWVVIDDLQTPAATKGRQGRQSNIARAVRIVKAAYAAGGLLTMPELAAMFNVAPVTMGEWLEEHYQRTGEVLPTKAQVLDVGSQPSHKDIVVYLYEQKLDAVEIARRTHHHLSCVEVYIQDYERVKVLLSKGMLLAEIAHATGRSLNCVRQYCKLAQHYHPEPPSTEYTSKLPET
jgi:hypothetical protein